MSMTEKKKTAKAAKKEAPAPASEPKKTEPKAATSDDVGQAELQTKADAQRGQGFAGALPDSETTQTVAEATGKD
jgi:hypothetical protein